MPPDSPHADEPDPVPTRPQPAAEEAIEETIDLQSSVRMDGSTLEMSGKARRSPPPKIDGYDIIEEIARGGMGVVYKARQQRLNRLVALKMIRGAQLASEEEVRRFYTEAEAAAQLDHPHIVPVYEFGEQDGQHYFTMALIEGRSLEAKLQQGPLAPGEAAAIVSLLSRAISYAHSKDVVHRDLKPANVLLDADGRPKITDFGLAKRTASDSSLTATGQIMGTPAFMPPEQASGQIADVGPLADVYSLGAMFYSLLTGRPPFQASSVVETLKQVLEQEPVSPRDVNPQVPRDLETICLACLQKAPSRRYASAAELADDLDRFLNGEPIRARPISSLERFAKWVRRRPWLAGMWATTIAALVMVVATLGVSVNRISHALGLEKSSRVTAEEQTAIAVRERQNAEDRRIEANRLRMVADRQRTRANRSKEQALAALEESDGSLLFSRLRLARQEWLANNVLAARQILERCPPDLRNWEWHYLYRLCRGELHVLRHGDRGTTNAVFSHDGRLVAAGSVDGFIRIWDAETGKQIQLLRAGTSPLSCVAFHPQQQQIAALAADKSLRLWDFKTGKVVKRFSDVQRNAGAQEQLVFNNKGNLLLTPRGKVLDLENNEVILSAASVPNLDVAFTPSGEQVVVLEIENLHFRDLASGKSVRKLPVAALSFAISPDGKRIALGLYDGVTIIDAATGNNIISLRGQRDRFYEVVFSPDGKHLFGASGDMTIRIWNSETGELLSTLRGHPGSVRTIDLNQDATRLVSTCVNSVRLWDPNRDPERQLMTEDGSGVALGAGYHLVTFGTAVKGLTIRDLRTGKQLIRRPEAGTVLTAAFSPAGDLLATGSADGKSRVWESQTGNLVTTFDGHQGAVDNIAFSSDGQWLATSGNDRTVRVWNAQTGKQKSAQQGLPGKVYRLRFLSSTGEIGLLVRGQLVLFDPAAQTGNGVRVLPQRAVFDFAVSPDGKQLAVVQTSPRAIALVDAATGEPLQAIRCPTPVGRIAYSPDGTRLATVSRAGTTKEVTVWDVARGEAVINFRQREIAGLYTGVRFDPSSRFLVAKSSRAIHVWDASPGSREYALPTHGVLVTGIKFLPEPNRILTGSMDGTIRFWDSKRGHQLGRIPAHGRNVLAVALSPDAATIATVGGVDKLLRLWDRASGEQRHEINVDSELANRVAYSPDGNTVATGGNDGIVKLFSPDSAQLIRELVGHSTWINVILFSPDGRLVISAAGDTQNAGELKVWELATGECRLTVNDYKHITSDAKFLPSGDRFATSSWDGAVRIHELATGNEVLKIQGRYRLDSVAVSPDGKWIAAGSQDRRIHIWDAMSGAEVHTFPVPGAPAELKFSPDGSHLLSGDVRGTVRFWPTAQLLKD